MHPAYPRGVPFHGEFTSADASALTETNSRFTLYGARSTSSLTLTANSIVQVTDILASAGSTALVIQVYDGANNVVDAGEKIAVINAPANGGAAWTCHAPHYCQTGSGGQPYPKVKTNQAGQIDVTIRGFIYEDPGV